MSIQNDPAPETSPISPRNFRKIVRWEVITFSVGAIAGAIILGLALSQKLGSLGETRFFYATTGGGALSAISVGGLFWLAISSLKNPDKEAPVQSRGAIPCNNPDNKEDLPPKQTLSESMLSEMHPPSQSITASSEEESPPNQGAIPCNNPENKEDLPPKQTLSEPMPAEMSPPSQSMPAFSEEESLPINRESSCRDLFENLHSGNLTELIKALQAISPKFFAHKSRARAKEVFSRMMGRLLEAEVSFPKAGHLETPDMLTGALDPSIFHISETKGVQGDIPRSSKDPNRLHVYQVASQYNASEAPSVFTPRIGHAMEISQHDNTQGPLAQRTNPDAFELVTAFLTHLGFNMLDEVLPTAGRTDDPESSIAHGYLRPNSSTLSKLTDEFRDNFSRAEYVCYSSQSKDWGTDRNPVYIFLQSAPAIGYSFDLKMESSALQQYAALANFLALFRYGIELAERKQKPLVLHVAAVGCGVFRNDIKNIQWGFEKAALACQEKMKEAGVSVQLEAYGKNSPLKALADSLNIPSRERLGDSEG